MNSKSKNFKMMLIIGIVLLVVAFIFPAFANRRILNVAIIALMYITLGESWNILSGMSGLFSVHHAIFFGLGAYGVSLGLTKLSLPVPLAIVFGLLLNIVAATIVGFIGSKLSGLYFTMAIIGLWQVLFTFSYQFFNITGGTQGISMPKGLLMGKKTLYYIALALAVFAIFMYQGIRRSRLGTNFIALKENPDLAKALGSNIVKYRLLSTIISACLASLAGSFYSFYMMTNNPEVFSPTISLKIIMVVIVGGMGNVWGPVLGIVMVVLDEFVRGAMPIKFAPFSVIIYAIVLIVMILWKPGGLISMFKSKEQKTAEKADAEIIEETI